MSDAKTPRAELPALLGAREVAARYGLKDLPAARKLMRDAGGFLAAGRMVVRADYLDTFERARAEAGRRASTPALPVDRRTRRTHGARDGADEFPPGWWRAPCGEN